MDRGLLTAYVVPCGGLDLQRLHARLRSELPASLLPDAYIPLALLPLTESARIDEGRLTRLPLIEPDLAKKWERLLLKRAPQAGRVEVTIGEGAFTPPPLHLFDLPDGRRLFEAPDFPEPAGAEEERPSAESTKGKRLPPSISRGGPAVETGEVQLLPQILHRAAADFPQEGILCLGPQGSCRFLNYAELLGMSQSVLGGLAGRGLRKGDQVLVQLSQPQDFLPALWACLLGGMVAVPLAGIDEQGAAARGANQLGRALHLLERPLLLTNRPSLSALQGRPDLQPKLHKIEIALLEECLCKQPRRGQPAQDADETALLLLTSGSTGTPKGVPISHANMLTCAAGSAKVNRYCQRDVSLNWLPLNHVGALARTIRETLLCCRQIQAIPSLVLENPLRWLDWMEQYRATLSWAPNFAFGLILQQAAKQGPRKRDLASVRSLWTAGESISPAIMQAFLELLEPSGLSPKALHTSWGMTEANMATFSHSYLEKLASSPGGIPESGRPIPGLTIRIVDERDRIVPERTAGRVQVRGPACISAYWQSQLNKKAFASGGWLRTGDLGFLDQGSLTITGREKEVIIINGLNYSSREIESALESVKGLEPGSIAACRVRRRGSPTDLLAIFFCPRQRDGPSLRILLEEVRQCVLDRVGLNPDYLIPVDENALQRTELGKISRLDLRRRFEAGEFCEALKLADCLGRNQRTLPNWFYAKVWRPRKEWVRVEPLPEPALLFVDRQGLGAAFAKRLSEQGRQVWTVEPGAEFDQFHSGRFRIDPAQPAHYSRLFQSGCLRNLPRLQILYFWCFEGHAPQRSGAADRLANLRRNLQGLLCLGQALAGSGQEGPAKVRLVALTRHAQACLPEDRVDPAKTPCNALLKVLSSEVPRLACRHVDLPDAPTDELASLLEDELCILQDCPEVAYRQGLRWIPRLERASFAQGSRLPPRLRQGGLYLVSGGLGGVGRIVSRFLLERFRARLLILGRTPLPPRVAWHEQLPEGARGERLQLCRELERLPGDFLYESVDVADSSQVGQAVEKARRHWDAPLEGVFHLAGEAHNRPLLESDLDGLLQAIRPKTEGTQVLQNLISKEPHCFFVSFSSLFGCLGTPAAGAPALAHSFLEASAHQMHHHDSRPAYCLSWSLWQSAGMSRSIDAEAARLAVGIPTLSHRDALASLLAALQQSSPQLLIGLEAGHPRWRSKVEHEQPQLWRLQAYLDCRGADWPSDGLEALRISDRLGTPTRCEVQATSSWPPLQTRDRARDREGEPADQQGTDDSDPKRLAAAQTIADIFAEVVDAERVGLQDSFFGLGGTSILVTRAVSRLRDAFAGQRIPVVALFNHPTPASLAAFLCQSESDQDTQAAGRRRAELRRQLRRRRQSRQQPEEPSREVSQHERFSTAR